VALLDPKIIVMNAAASSSCTILTIVACDGTTATQTTTLTDKVLYAGDLIELEYVSSFSITY
jgi:hypothetical protein